MNWFSGGQQKKQAQNLLPQKTKAWVNFQGELQQKCLLLSERQIKNLQTLKKKILNQFRFQQSQTKKIQLNVMQIYPNQPENVKTPIFNEQSLRLIISFLANYQREIKIQVRHLAEHGELSQKDIISQEAIEKGQIHFDENGSLIQQNDQMIQNIPDNEKYDNSKGHVRCQFCQKNNLDKKYLKQCGGLYGPFSQEKYVHLLCALWCHRVYLDQLSNLLMNVDEEIKRAMKTKCRHCSQYGAGLVCVGVRHGKNKREVKCRKNYHFKCAYDSGCLMNWVSFKMLCNKCKEDQQLSQILEKGREDLGQSSQKQEEEDMQMEEVGQLVKLEDRHPQGLFSKNTKIKIEFD